MKTRVHKTNYIYKWQVVYVIWKLHNNIIYLHYYDNLHETITYKNTGIICNTNPQNNISTYIIMITWTWISLSPFQSVHNSVFVVMSLRDWSWFGFPFGYWFFSTGYWFFFYINPSIWKDSWLMGKSTKQMCWYITDHSWLHGSRIKGPEEPLVMFE